MTLLEQLQNITIQPQGPPYKSLHELCREAAAEIARLTAQRDRLLEALKPFAAAVYNDNGDMTVGHISDSETYIKAYFAMRSLEQKNDKP